MNNVHPTTRNTPVRSPYSTLFSTVTSFSSIRLSCHVISLPTCTIGADRPTRNNLTVSVSCLNLPAVTNPIQCKRSCIKLNPGTRPCCQISQATYGINPSIYSTCPMQNTVVPHETNLYVYLYLYIGNSYGNYSCIRMRSPNP